MAPKKKVKKKKPFVEMTLWDVILSYPDLHDPKPFKGKIYFQTDVLLDEDHPQLGELRKAIFKVKKDYWGEDKTEWVKTDKPLIQDGNSRSDQKGYKDRRFIVPKTQTPVPVVDLRGKAFNPQMIKGGMFANVAIRVAAWEYEGDEGVAIYLQGVQIDTKKKGLNFGGGKSVAKMFELEESEEEESEDTPRGKKKAKKKPSKFDRSNEEDQPKGKKKKPGQKREEEE